MLHCTDFNPLNSGVNPSLADSRTYCVKSFWDISNEYLSRVLTHTWTSTFSRVDIQQTPLKLDHFEPCNFVQTYAVIKIRVQIKLCEKVCEPESSKNMSDIGGYPSYSDPSFLGGVHCRQNVKDMMNYDKIIVFIFFLK